MASTVVCSIPMADRVDNTAHMDSSSRHSSPRVRKTASPALEASRCMASTPRIASRTRAGSGSASRHNLLGPNDDDKG